MSKHPFPVSRRTFLAFSALTGMSVSLPSAFANQAYPARQVKIVVPGAPGLALDIVVRIVAEALGTKYGQAFVIENRAGAGGMIGMQAYARMQPDGYTLMAGGLGLNVLPSAVFTNLPIDIPTVFTPIAQMAESANLLVVRSDLGVNNLTELVALAKSKPGELAMGCHDRGSSMHMSYELLAQKTGTKWLYTPYKGPSEVLAGLLSGTVHAGLSSVGPFVQMIKSGRLKAIAVTTSYRQRMLPEVPTMQEAGVPGFDVGSWLSLHGLPGTPPAILEQLSRDIVEVVQQPEVRKRLELAGYTPRPLGTREFKAKLDSELARWNDVAKQAGVVMDYRTRT